MPLNVEHSRNLAIVLGCVAEKLAGPRSVALLTTATLEYLIGTVLKCTLEYLIGTVL